MRKIILAGILAASVPVMGATVAGCSWFQAWQTNPYAQAQSFEQSVQVILNDAQVAWAFVQPFLPPATAAQINVQFNNAIFAVNHALQVLNDGITVAEQAGQTDPNFATLMNAVTDAIGQVLAIIQQYTQKPVADAGVGPNTLADGGPDGGGPVGVARLAPATQALTDAQSSLAGLKKNYHLSH